MNLERALARRLAGKRPFKELVAHLRDRLPGLEQPTSRGVWLKRAARVRRELLSLFFEGHPPGLLDGKFRVVWEEVIDPGQGYRIRKLRYEGYPGMWVPALLYQPERLSGKVPVVMNPNGHHAGGKAMDYKQARCINIAKRGMLALNTEFIGMGELRADVDHNRIGHLDVCGVAGIGVFYLLMKRGLDVLLSHRHADLSRVAMTGLSGGGWQTALLSSLDERITLCVPVAGHSPIWERNGESNMGDLEQSPSDFCTVTDFDVLTALLAPRPTLLIYNRKDEIECFRTRRTRRSVYGQARPVFELLGAGGNVGLHDNVDPGTHNYESDNRSQFYKFLNKHFGLDTPGEDLPWQGELQTEEALRVGLPLENETLLSLAAQASREIRRERQAGRSRGSAAERRKRFASVLRLPECAVTSSVMDKPRRAGGVTVRQMVLRMDDAWSMPVTEISPSRPAGVEVIVGDGGRRSAGRLARSAVEAGRRALVADLFGSGEAFVPWQYHMTVASTGERPLGLQVGQLNALVSWACKQHRVSSVCLTASGQVMPVVALSSAALHPGRVRSLTTSSLIDSLHRLIDWPLPYANVSSLFCFGLLKAFDISDLIALSAPVPIQDNNRGPLR